jgi:DNA-binding NarL/FixJ family response regulator
VSETVPRPAIRVFLLVQNRLLREALIRLFRKRSDISVVGQCEKGQISTHEALEANSDVLVLSYDGGLLPPGLQLEVDGSRLRALLLGMEANEEHFLAAVRSGVAGCLLKEASASDVVSAIRALYRGEAVCPAQFCMTLFRLVAEMHRDPASQLSAPRPDLTIRQQQLMRLVAKGLTNKEIATRLNLSEFTVRNHIHRILKQVDAGSRTEAVEAVRSYGYEISA